MQCSAKETGFALSYLLSRQRDGGVGVYDGKKGPHSPCIALFLRPVSKSARALFFAFACQKGVLAPKRVVFEPRKQ